MSVRVRVRVRVRVGVRVRGRGRRAIDLEVLLLVVDAVVVAGIEHRVVGHRHAVLLQGAVRQGYGYD